MRWLLGLLVFLPSLVSAQSIMSIVNAKSGVAYVGPGDIVSGATAWYGLRGYSAAYAATGTGKAINYRRASDNSTQDGVILTNGKFDIATANAFAGPDGGTGVCTASTSGSSTTLTIASCATSATLHSGDTLTCASCVQPVYISALGTFSGTGAGASGTVTLNAAQNITSQSVTSQIALFVPEIYDQSGNLRHLTQLTAAKQPQLLPSCGSLPCISFVGSATQWLGPVTIALPGATTFSLVSNRLAAGSMQIALSMTTSVAYVMQYQAVASQINAVGLGGTTITGTPSDGAFHAIQAVINGASPASFISVDGSNTTGSLTTGTNAGQAMGVGASGNGGQPFTGYGQEWAVWPAAMTTTQTSNICHNQTYWGAFGC